jgi:ligand-binding sensor domain-containing protein
MPMNIRTFLALLIHLFLLFTTPLLWSQSQSSLKFTSYTVKNGLCHDFVSTIAKDKKGFLWLGTSDGLSRFDGVTFKNFQHNPDNPHSLRSNRIYEILFDQYDRLWISEEKGICWMDETNQKFNYVENEIIKPLVIHKSPLCLDVKNNKLWVGTGNSSFLLTIDLGSLTFTKDTFFLDNCVPLKLVLNHQIDCIIATMDDNFIYTIDTKKMKKFKQVETIKSNKKPYIDAQNRIWCGQFGGGLLEFVQSTSSPFNIFLKKVTAISNQDLIFNCVQSTRLTGENILWLADQFKGVVLFDKAQNKTINRILHEDNLINGFPHVQVQTFFNDNEGICWAGTDKGLIKCNPNDQQFTTEKIANIDYFDISSVGQDPGNADFWWLGSEYSHLIHYNHKLKQQDTTSSIFNKIKNLGKKGKGVRKIIFDEQGTLWAALHEGIIKINTNHQLEYLPLYHKKHILDIFDLQFDKDGNLLIGSNLGLCNYDIESRKLTFLVETKYEDYCKTFNFGQDKNGNILGAMQGNGFYVYDDSLKTSLLLNQFLPKEVNSVNAVKSDSKGVVWLATDEGLVKYYPLSKSYQLLGLKEGLKNRNCKGIVIDKLDNIWVCTDNGLFKYIQNKKKFEHFDATNGLPIGKTSSHIYTIGHEIWLPSAGSLTRWNPYNLSVNNNFQNTFITGFKIYDDEQIIAIDSTNSKPFLVDYEDKSLTFEFSCPDYTASEKVTFEYFIDGFSKEWTNNGTSHAATITNLTSGDYTFKVRSINANGIKSNSIAQFKFCVNPPFWEWWSFRLFILGCICGFIWGVFNIRLRKLKLENTIERQKTELQKKEAIYQKEVSEVALMALKAQMKPHFIFNALNSINQFTRSNDPNKASRYLTRFAKLMRMMLDQSNQKYITLKEELQILELYAEMESLRLGNRVTTNIIVEDGLDTDLVEIPPALLQPYVENAFLHGFRHKPDQGFLSINVSQPKKDWLKIEIRDNGVGIEYTKKIDSAEAEKRTSHGTRINEDRFRIMRETYHKDTQVLIENLKDENNLALGTLVTVLLPI